MDPACDLLTGLRIPEHGDTYAPSLELSGTNPDSEGLRERPPIARMKKA
jgi:hypothetical protein